MDMHHLIEEKKSALTWQVSHEMGARDLEITSDPWSRTHTIKMPMSGADWRPIEYLHELAHATLAERHHLLSTAFFARGYSQSDINQLINPIRCASDWLADHLLMQWCPEEEKAEIREHADMVRQLADPPDNGLLYMGGLMLSQSEAYLGKQREKAPRPYRKVIFTLMEEFPPGFAVRVKQRLINRLASLTTNLSVSIVQDDGMDVWQIRKEKS